MCVCVRERDEGWEGEGGVVKRGCGERAEVSGLRTGRGEVRETERVAGR